MERPAPIVTDDEVVRRDIDSDDMRRVHPDLPSTTEGRLQHVIECDWNAYQSITATHPLFFPPRSDARGPFSP